MNSKIDKDIPLKEKAYLKLKDKIIKCKLQPGEMINEIELAEKFSMSRTPVREAILKLSSEDLVTIYPRKGIMVSEITLKDIREVFQIRELIEPEAAKKFHNNMSEEYLISMRKKFEEIEFQLIGDVALKYYDLDIEFHKYIIASTKNDMLIEFIDKIYDRDYRIRVKSTLMIEDIEDRSKPEHFEVIDALLSGNSENIYNTLKTHLENSKKAALLQI